jgi:leucyl aminopeptidase (aminopeptidase T)
MIWGKSLNKMSLLVREIVKAKWMQHEILSVEDVSADAITNCMKTKENTLSAWQVAEEKTIEDAALAIVSSHQHLDTIDVVCLDPSSLESNGIKLQSIPGNTPVKYLKDQHIDICDLTYRTLGTVAEQIVHVLKEGKDVRYTKGKIKKLLKDAIDQGHLQRDDLDESLSKKI